MITEEQENKMEALVPPIPTPTPETDSIPNPTPVPTSFPNPTPTLVSKPGSIPDKAEITIKKKSFWDRFFK